MAAAALFLASAACDDAAQGGFEAAAPVAGEGLEPLDPAAFGSLAWAMQARSETLAHDQLAGRYGPLDVHRYTWPAERPRGELIAAWDAALTAQGYRRIETGLETLPDFLIPGAWMAAWGARRSVVALVGQVEGAGAEGRTPVTVLENRRGG